MRKKIRTSVLQSIIHTFIKKSFLNNFKNVPIFLLSILFIQQILNINEEIK
nr:MAG TPA: hypothetical protein [Caudoviricetes sp.]